MTSELVERLRAERDRMWKECRLPTKRTYTTATPDMLGQAAAEIERLTAQLAEARQAERAAEDRAWEQARELVRGTNADMCKTARQAYRIICGDMTNAVNNRQLRTLQGRVEARSAARKTGEPA